MAATSSSGKLPSQISTRLANGDTVELEELDKSGNVQRRWLHEPSNRLVEVQLTPSDKFLLRLIRDWKKYLFEAFLPVGFPHSVSEDYLAYQTYDSLQAFFSTITSLLANRALLKGLGVGDANSSATFALLLTILKDAMSRVATIVFAHRFGLQIEPDAKRYRFLADLFNDTAFFLELYSPYLTSWGKIAALSTGEALRALCGVAAGASKAALSVHFAKHDNLAELNAKEASQETAVGMVGLLVGTLVVRVVEGHSAVVLLMIALVFAHLWMNYLGVRSVRMTTLNRQRATILFQEYLKSGTILTPTQVAKREAILLWTPVVRNTHGQKVASIEIARNYGEVMQNNRLGHILEGSMHSTVYLKQGRGIAIIRIIFWQGATAEQAISAWFEAIESAWWTDSQGTCNIPEPFVNEPRYKMAELWRGMRETGWDLSSQALETGVPVRLRIRDDVKKIQ